MRTEHHGRDHLDANGHGLDRPHGTVEALPSSPVWSWASFGEQQTHREWLPSCPDTEVIADDLEPCGG